MLLPGVLMVVLANFGCDRYLSVVIFTAALTINGAVTAGYLGNGLDIAPNFSGTIFGMANTLSSLGGGISSFMVGKLTYQNQKFQQWSIVFWVLAATYTTGALTFLIFGSGELEKWNNPAETVAKITDDNLADLGSSCSTSGEENLPLKKKYNA